MRTRWATVVALTILSACPLAGTGPLEVRVSPREARAPADILVCAIVDPDPANRLLAVEIESPQYFSSSSVELDGESARRVNDFAFRQLPAGEYEVRVAVYDTSGRPRGSITRDVSIWQ